MNFIKNGRVYDVMPCADSFNDIHEIKCGQAEEKLEAGGDEKLIFNFIWPYIQGLITTSGHTNRTVLLLRNCVVIVLCVCTMARLKVNCHKWAE